jgi:hypothetical protein
MISQIKRMLADKRVWVNHIPFNPKKPLEPLKPLKPFKPLKPLELLELLTPDSLGGPSPIPPYPLHGPSVDSCPNHTQTCPFVPDCSHSCPFVPFRSLLCPFVPFRAFSCPNMPENSLALALPGRSLLRREDSHYQLMLNHEPMPHPQLSCRTIVKHLPGEAKTSTSRSLLRREDSHYQLMLNHEPMPHPQLSCRTIVRHLPGEPKTTPTKQHHINAKHWTFWNAGPLELIQDYQ